MKTKYILRILLFFSIILVPLIVAAIIFRSSLVFDPVLFINKYIDFIFQLISIFISFVLLNLFWETQQRKRQMSLTQNRLTISLTRLKRLVKETKGFINLRVSDTENRIVEENEEIVLQKFNQLNSFREGISTLTLEDEIEEDHNLSTAFDIFWSTLSPIINDLSKRKTIYPDIDEINKKLDELSTGISAILKAIR